MTIDEQKIVSDISTESDGLKDFNSFSRLSRDYKLRKQQKKLFLFIIILFIYFIIALGALFVFRNNPYFLFWPLDIGKESRSITALDQRLSILENKSVDLQDLLAQPTSTSVSNNIINLQLVTLSNRQEALEESINLNPEKALTAGLLREKQKNLEDNFIQLRSVQERLDSKLDNFITTAILGPIVVAIIGLIVWFIQRKFKKED